jgi:hypothetical protein
VDLRRHTRIPADFTFLVNEEGGDGRLVQALDVSLGGIRFNSVGSGCLAEDLLTACFNIDDEYFAVRSRVVRARDLDGFSQEVAVSFDGIGGDMKRRLRRAIHHC